MDSHSAQTASDSSNMMDELVKCIETIRGLVTQKTNLEKATVLESKAKNIVNKLAFTVTDLAIRSTTNKSTPHPTEPAKRSYLEVLRQTKAAKIQPDEQKIKPLFIKLGPDHKADAAVAKIKENIDPVADDINIIGATAVNEKTVKIMLAENGKSADRCKDKITTHFPGCQVEEERKLQPRIVIFNVPTDRTEDRLLDELYYQNEAFRAVYNQDYFKANAKVIKKGVERQVRGTAANHVTLQITGGMLQRLMQTNTRQIISLAWLRCEWKISDTYLRCRKCLRCGHNEANCKREVCCSRCGGNHTDKDCDKYSDQHPHCFLCSKVLKADAKAATHKLEDKKNCLIHRQMKERLRARLDMTLDYE